MKINKLLTLTLLSPFIVNASMKSSMEDFFSNSSIANYNSANIVKSQQGNYLTGGSAVIKTPVDSIRLANFQLPSINAGCGGIDLFTGGFGFINASQLVDFSQSIMQNAIPFAFSLALQTFEPSIESQLTKFQRMAEEANSYVTNSCQAAEALVDNIGAPLGWNKAKEHLCQSLGTQSGAYGDWADAKYHCSKKEERDKTIDNNKEEAAKELELPDNTNLTWWVYQTKDHPESKESTSLDSDQEVAEFLMSLIGTYINSEDSTGSYKPLYSLAKPELIDVIVNGGRTTVYKCASSSSDASGKNGCLTLETKEFEVDPKDAERNTIEQKLRDIAEKFQENESLEDEDLIDFININSLPILGMLKTDLALKMTPDYAVLAEFIAYKRVSLFMDSVVNTLVTVSSNKNTGGNKHFKEILSNAMRVRDTLSELPKESEKYLLEHNKLIDMYSNRYKDYLNKNVANSNSKQGDDSEQKEE